MKDLTATEAARRFSEVLDAVEHRRETFVIRRKGRAVARIEPVAGTNWGAVLEVLRKNPVDERWLDELRELRASLPVPEAKWPD